MVRKEASVSRSLLGLNPMILLPEDTDPVPPVGSGLPVPAPAEGLEV